MKSVRPISTVILAVIAVIVSTLLPYTYTLRERTDAICASGCYFDQHFQVHGWPFWFLAAPHLAGGVIDRSSFPVPSLAADFVFWVLVMFLVQLLFGLVRKRRS
jgi:hypothetical protein